MKKIIAIILAGVTLLSLLVPALTTAFAAETTFDASAYDSVTEINVNAISLAWTNHIASGHTIGTSSTVATDDVTTYGGQYVGEDGVQYTIKQVSNSTCQITAIDVPIGTTEVVIPQYITIWQLVLLSDSGKKAPVNETGARSVNGNVYSWDFSSEIKNAGEEDETGPRIGVEKHTYQITSINSAFKGINHVIETVIIPKLIKNIDASAFESNPYIKNVYAPGVEEIRDKAFYDCKNLENIIVPKVRYIGKQAFYKDNMLRDFDFSTVLKIGESSFVDCVKLTRVNFSVSIQELGKAAFKGCTGITNIDIPQGISINTIPDECFYNCTRIENVVLPYEIITIGSKAFYGCATLPNLDFRNTHLDTINSQAFDGCLRLEYVVLPSTLVTFKSNAFDNCSSLRYVCFTNALSEDQLTELKKSDLWNCSVTDVNSIAPILYNASQKVSIGEEKVTISRPTDFEIYGLVDISSVEITGTPTITPVEELADNHNTYKTYIYKFSVDTEGTYKVTAKDFVGHTKTFEIKYEKVPVNYSVAYHGNGGTYAGETVYSSSHVTDVEKALTTNQFTKNGYSFKGWATTEGSEQVVYTDEQIVENLALTEGAVFNLYAVWEPMKFTLKYDANGGIGNVLSGEYTYGNNIRLTRNTFANEGYTFTGWKYSYNGEDVVVNEYATIKDIDVTSETAVVCATWTPNCYTVKFNANGGLGDMKSQGFTYDKSGNLNVNTYTRTGYDFAGWDTDSRAKTVRYADGSTVLNLASAKDATKVLYAVWTPHTYSVVFDANGGEGYMSPLTVNYGTETKLTANTYVKTGYIFSGWATSPNGTVVYGNGKSVLNLRTENNETVTLYAVWTPIEYTVKYNGNGATNGVLVSTSSHTYDKEAKLLVNSYVKTGYKFLGWSLVAKGTVDYKDCETVKNLCTKNKATITLYAVWQKYIKGDVDGDENVSASDARLALRASVGLEEYKVGSEKYNACDVNGDGKITAADARLILRASVGLENFDK